MWGNGECHQKLPIRSGVEASAVGVVLRCHHE
jgi:hypothetical protein